MKRIIVLVMAILTLWAFAIAEDHVIETYLNVGGDMVMPAAGSYILVKLDGVMVDSVYLDSTSNFQEVPQTILCTLTTAAEDLHTLLGHFVYGGDIYTLIEPLDNRPDTIQRNASILIGGDVADAVWNEDTTSHNTAASFGVFIKDTLAFQGSVSGLTVGQIIDSILKMVPADTGNGSLLGQLIKGLSATRDSLQYLVTATGFSTHSAADVWAVVARTLTDKTGFSLSDANISVLIDSLMGLLPSDTGNGGLFGQLLFELSATLDTLQNQDNWGTHQTTSDSLYSVVDSLIKWSGYRLGSHSKTVFTNDSDRLWIYFNLDTIGCLTYYHVGDTAGYPPDSTKFFPVDSLR